MTYFSFYIFATSVLCYLINSEKVVREVKTQGGISNILEAFGYSPSCIATSLATCEDNKHSSSFSDAFNTFATEIKAEIQDIRESVARPHNCADLYAKGDNTSGVRTVYPFTCCPNRAVSVYCDQTTDGGRWTVIQKRDALPLREDFYRTWIEYVLGFGNLTGEFWLGLENIHSLVGTTLNELRVDLEDYDGGKRWAKYGIFYVGDSESKYTLNVGKYSGDAGDDLSLHNEMKFSTHDVDHDTHSGNCAQTYCGAWWYKDCHYSNLNGFQYEGKHTSPANGINWNSFRGHNYSLKKSVINVRPAFENY